MWRLWKKNSFKVFLIRKSLQKHLAHKIHIFCTVDFNGEENVNFVCQTVLQGFSYKKQTLENNKRIIRYLNDIARTRLSSIFHTFFYKNVS